MGSALGEVSRIIFIEKAYLNGPIARVAYEWLDSVYGARSHARRPRGFAEMLPRCAAPPRCQARFEAP